MDIFKIFKTSSFYRLYLHIEFQFVGVFVITSRVMKGFYILCGYGLSKGRSDQILDEIYQINV